MKRMFCLASLLLAGLFSGSSVFAAGALEIPQPNSGQSGVSIVSGWHCSATRIEVTFDGGPKIATAYGTTRADTKGPCGDENNGFSLLWAYGLLGTGTHEVVAYADGVEFGRSTFQVTDIANKGFVTGKSSAKRVYGFPDINHDLILQWQEANQNYVISDMVGSMDSYDVSGRWSVYDGSTFNSFVTLFIYPSVDDPRIGYVDATEIIPTGGGLWRGIGYGGAITLNKMIIGTAPELGADVTAKLEVLFTGARTGTVKLTECAPSYDCPYPIGYTLRLVKEAPDADEALLPSSVGTGANDALSPIDQMTKQIAEQMTDMLMLSDEGAPQ